MDREVLRQELIDGLTDLAGRWVVGEKGRKLARAGAAYWRTAQAGELDRFLGLMDLLGDFDMATKQKMTEAQARQLATALGIDWNAVNWRDLLDKAVLVLTWLRDLLGRQPMQATAGAAGAKAGMEGCCCACLEAADLAIQAAQTSLACACDCCTP